MHVHHHDKKNPYYNKKKLKIPKEFENSHIFITVAQEILVSCDSAARRRSQVVLHDALQIHSNIVI